MPQTPEDNVIGVGDYETTVVKDFPDWRSAFDYVLGVLTSHQHRGIDQTKPLQSPRVMLNDAATVESDCSLSSHFYVTLTDNRTLANPKRPRDGQRLIFEIIQDSTGSRTLALDTKFAFGTSITAITLTTTASVRDFLGCIYSAKDDKFYVVAFSPGY